MVKIVCSFLFRNKRYKGLVEFLQQPAIVEKSLDSKRKLITNNIPVVLIEEHWEAIWP